MTPFDPSSVLPDVSHLHVGFSAPEYAAALLMERNMVARETAPHYMPEPVEVPTPSELQSTDSYFLARRYTQSRPAAGRVLILANDYPTPERLYANGFIHRRIVAYREAGLDVDVMAFGKRRGVGVTELDGVSVIHGYIAELQSLLALRAYDTIAVHFLNSEMWNTLLPWVEKVRLIVHVHGYEARHWLRTAATWSSVKAMENAIRRTMLLRTFWASVLGSGLVDRFVFVSQWARRASEGDMELLFPDRLTDVIPNYVDAETFPPRLKRPEDRYRVLFIRPASNRNYGHDLAIDVVRRVLDSPNGHNFHFTMCGDGEFFSDVESAFEDQPRVDVRRGFLSQQDIAREHARHGVFLVPTRLDTQGVSRDEAMSSGLVPVTNAVAAVPEFADESCAIMSPPEDTESMAAGILALGRDPDKYLALSKAATERAQRMAGYAVTIDRELALLTGERMLEHTHGGRGDGRE